MQLQGEMDFIFYVFPRTRKCRKSLDFHKPIIMALVCTISGKILELESRSQDLGGFPQKNYETVRKKTQTEENTSWENE